MVKEIRNIDIDQMVLNFQRLPVLKKLGHRKLKARLNEYSRGNKDITEALKCYHHLFRKITSGSKIGQFVIFNNQGDRKKTITIYYGLYKAGLLSAENVQIVKSESEQRFPTGLDALEILLDNGLGSAELLSAVLCRLEPYRENLKTTLSMMLRMGLLNDASKATKLILTWLNHAHFSTVAKILDIVQGQRLLNATSHAINLEKIINHDDIKEVEFVLTFHKDEWQRYNFNQALLDEILFQGQPDQELEQAQSLVQSLSIPQYIKKLALSSLTETETPFKRAQAIATISLAGLLNGQDATSNLDKVLQCAKPLAIVSVFNLLNLHQLISFVNPHYCLAVSVDHPYFYRILKLLALHTKINATQLNLVIHHPNHSGLYEALFNYDYWELPHLAYEYLLYSKEPKELLTALMTAWKIYSWEHCEVYERLKTHDQPVVAATILTLMSRRYPRITEADAIIILNHSDLAALLTARSALITADSKNAKSCSYVASDIEKYFLRQLIRHSNPIALVRAYNLLIVETRLFIDSDERAETNIRNLVNYPPELLDYITEVLVECKKNGMDCSESFFEKLMMQPISKTFVYACKAVPFQLNHSHLLPIQVTKRNSIYLFLHYKDRLLGDITNPVWMELAKNSLKLTSAQWGHVLTLCIDERTGSEEIIQSNIKSYINNAVLAGLNKHRFYPIAPDDSNSDGNRGAIESVGFERMT